jgi:hypothetical protein
MVAPYQLTKAYHTLGGKTTMLSLSLRSTSFRFSTDLYSTSFSILGLNSALLSNQLSYGLTIRAAVLSPIVVEPLIEDVKDISLVHVLLGESAKVHILEDRLDNPPLVSSSLGPHPKLNVEDCSYPFEVDSVIEIVFELLDEELFGNLLVAFKKLYGSLNSATRGLTTHFCEYLDNLLNLDSVHELALIVSREDVKDEAYDGNFILFLEYELHVTEEDLFLKEVL